MLSLVKADNSWFYPSSLPRTLQVFIFWYRLQNAEIHIIYFWIAHILCNQVLNLPKNKILQRGFVLLYRRFCYSFEYHTLLINTYQKLGIHSFHQYICTSIFWCSIILLFMRHCNGKCHTQKVNAEATFIQCTRSLRFL